MANNVIDAAIRLRDLFTSTVRSVNASLGTMKAQLAAAKQSVSGLLDKLTEHERIQNGRRRASSRREARFRPWWIRRLFPCRRSVMKSVQIWQEN